uniref:Reverse transcriptase domain-containing protein n=1 Tax=Salarias fasciatus TaxID=181472 RepID=A0A672IKH9_SALFA
MANAAGSIVRFICWNIKGLGGAVKRSRVFSHLKRLKPDIIFLQETHMRSRDQVRLRCPWISEVFHSSFNSKARGVAILIAKSVQFTHNKTISDRDGRYLIVLGTIFDSPVLLVNVYAPNFDNPGFMNNLFENLPSLNDHLLVFGGDLNCAINPELDRSTSVSASSQMAKALSSFMSSGGYVDPWRCRNPTSREYSFYSHVHQTFSRIDYFFIDGSLLSKVVDVMYHPIVISDHSPVSLDIQIQSRPRYSLPWRFNTSLLSDDKFCGFIMSAIDDFISCNQSDSNPVSKTLLWESLKAYLRGQIISYSAYLKKLRDSNIKKLSSEIKCLDQQLAAVHCENLTKRRVALQTDLDLITTTEAERLLMHSRSKYYEHGDKSGRLLAHQLRRQTSSRLIPRIKDGSGTLVEEPRLVNSVFSSFCESLYSSEFSSNVMVMHTFLNGLDFPIIDQESAAQLDSELTAQELVLALQSMNNLRTPGPDGYPVEFFKTFHAKLIPLLHSVYLESLSSGCLPPTLRQASISLILKKEKDPDLCTSYRPVSLMNVDAKILAKALACRLEKILPSVISNEQTGFIKGRQLFYNVRTLLNVLYSRESSASPEVVIAVDAEKAFDRVEWRYLFAVLTKFGFGRKFISWIRLLYTLPCARVVTNNIQSNYFTLNRGCRQGCPLSPLLFALAIEPLSILLRSSPWLTGIVRKHTEFKLSLYADDLLLYVTDPKTVVPNMISTFHRFGLLSGYRINVSKCECYPVNKPALQLSSSDVPFRISTSGFKYLGVQLTRSYKSLYASNFLPLLAEMKADFQRWNFLPLSLIGRINTVKMVVLPKFLFLCQNLPIVLPKAFFKSVDSVISHFLWKGRPPRVRLKVLQSCKFEGGLSLPNFQFYYWAVNITRIAYWTKLLNVPWCQLEAQSCTSSSLSALLTGSITTNPSGLTSSPVVISTLKIWFQFRKQHGFTGFSPLTPLLGNHAFKPTFIDPVFSIWHEKGLRCFKDFYKDGVFYSFTDLAQEFTLPSSHLFRYFQMRHCAKLLFPSFPHLPPAQPWAELLQLNPSQKSLITKIYVNIQAFNSNMTTKIKEAWENELGLTLDNHWWDSVLQHIHKSTICARLTLIQFKVLFRCHYSKTRLAKIFPSTLDICDRCGLSPCNLTHMFFSCSALANFWRTYFDTMSKVLLKTVDFSPCVAIFGLPVDFSNYSPLQLQVISFTSLIARRHLLLQWKSVTAPSSKRWICEVMSFL